MFSKYLVLKETALKKAFLEKKLEKLLFVTLCFSFDAKIYSQSTCNLKPEKFSLHFQSPSIGQYKPSFNAAYTVDQSLIPQSKTQRSFTSTFYTGLRVGESGGLFINPGLV